MRANFNTSRSWRHVIYRIYPAGARSTLKKENANRRNFWLGQNHRTDAKADAQGISKVRLDVHFCAERVLFLHRQVILTMYP